MGAQRFQPFLSAELLANPSIFIRAIDAHRNTEKLTQLQCGQLTREPIIQAEDDLWTSRPANQISARLICGSNQVLVRKTHPSQAELVDASQICLVGIRTRREGRSNSCCRRWRGTLCGVLLRATR